jgi:hypothetical protein
MYFSARLAKKVVWTVQIAGILETAFMETGRRFYISRDRQLLADSVGKVRRGFRGRKVGV